MPRMIDLIRASAVPANLMQSAARGSLSIPSDEMLEILVYLATENKVFGEQASLTLAGWDEKVCRAAAINPATPSAVLSYLVDPRNFRPALLQAVVHNPAVSEAALAKLATSVSRDQVETFLSSQRVRRSSTILSALSANPNLTGIQGANIAEAISASTAKDKESPAEEPAVLPQKSKDAPPADPIPAKEAVADEQAVATPPAVEASTASESEKEDDKIGDEELAAYLAEHAAEIASEGSKPFQPLGGTHDEFSMEATPAKEELAAAGKLPEPAKPVGEQRGSALQKIARLGITGRIQLAVKGSKEERSLLIRDGTKIVALAVLDSPKISDGEVEKFASQKNVLETVLRAIPMKRRFMKNYVVVKNLVFNPRTPLDVALTLVKNLLPNDLKVLSGTKEVSETVRKLAMRMYTQKMEKK
ncbi:MAG: hypothetical protein M3O09_18505 [Acidobacteriota bacterium]|nr:hypothetical protein [Acidobacteriota bacterium]